MRLGKKAMLALSFTVGACLFVTTALADIALGTGYDRLKDSIKHTSAQMEDGLDSYTLETRLSLQLDRQSVYESTSILKADTARGAWEEATNEKRLKDEYSSHFYQDKQMYARKNFDENRYYVTEYGDTDRDRRPFEDPFKEEVVGDFERILDALVGSLKHDVIVEQQPDGGKLYQGVLSEAQVPALINAVLSFVVKQTAFDHTYSRDNELPRIQHDVYVKRLSGQATENEAGLLEQIVGEVVLSGADDSGEQHELAYNFSIALRDVGSTTVTKPDLTGAVIQKVSNQTGFSDKDIGVYRNNIVIEEDDRLLKIGERTLEITGVGSESITGKYYETIDPEYAEMYPYEPLSFEFVTEPMQWMMNSFMYVIPDGREFYGDVSPGSLGKIHLTLYAEWDEEHETIYFGDYMDDIDYDYDYYRVFD